MPPLYDWPLTGQSIYLDIYLDNLAISRQDLSSDLHLFYFFLSLLPPFFPHFFFRHSCMSYISGWLLIHCTAKEGLVLMIIQPLPPECRHITGKQSTDWVTSQAPSVSPDPPWLSFFRCHPGSLMDFWFPEAVLAQPWSPHVADGNLEHLILLPPLLNTHTHTTQNHK